MSKKLSDGTVVPSTLSMERPPSARDLLMADYALKVGTVTDIFYPEEKSNISQQNIEYNVMVSDINQQGNVTLRLYRNCLISNPFGMSNNNLTYTLQADNADDGRIEFGSLVLLLCVSGQSSGGAAIIIGGAPHPNGTKYKKDDGQFYDFNFNGINYNINKDGEWTLTFNTPVDKNGKKLDEKAAGTQIKIDKEGKLKLSDNEGQLIELDRVNQKATWSNGADFIVIDKKNKKIELSSSGDLSSKSTKKTEVSSDDNMTISSKKDISAKSDANMQVEAKSNMSQKSGANWQVKANANVTIKAGANVLIEGGTLAQLKGNITMLGAGSVPVAAVGVSICLGTGNAGFPVVSQILTGSATVFVGT